MQKILKLIKSVQRIKQSILKPHMNITTVESKPSTDLLRISYMELWAESNPGMNEDNSKLSVSGDSNTRIISINAVTRAINKPGENLVRGTMVESNPGMNVNESMVQMGDNNTMNVYLGDTQTIDRPAENLDVDQVQNCLKETCQRMIDVENYKEVPWNDEVTNFNDFFTREHVKTRAQKRNPKKNEKSEEQSLILPDDFRKLFTYGASDVKPMCLVGEPGMGKTTQIVKQVSIWDSSPFLKTFPMLFYIPLNELPAENACIYTYIYKNLLNPEIRKVLPIDSFKEFLPENAKKRYFS
ncbi:uncharacterized protein LOC141907592 [Tubulanus polymorphus]|uniref:uncharacterized protein LOC141907592 n=1 Tax=Tubulanus polymorphus TaxID=672921 RepID=UPI003DA1F7D1